MQLLSRRITNLKKIEKSDDRELVKVYEMKVTNAHF